MRYFRGKLFPAVFTSREQPRWKMLTATVSLAVVLAGCSGSPEAAPVSPVTLKPHEVVYAATGEGTTAATYTLVSEDGATSQGNVDLPLTGVDGKPGITSTTFKPGAFLYLSIQNTQGFGSVTCQIKVDGVVVSRASGNGGYMIATCKGQVP